MAKISREEWLRHAVEEIDKQIFDGALELDVHHDFQIACGWCKGPKALGETIFPYQGEDVELDDFFPVTIHINCSNKITDPIMLLEVLTHECIHAFFDIRDHKKAFAIKAKIAGFEKPYRELNVSQSLKDRCIAINMTMKEKWGEWPGKAIVIKKKEKEKKKNSFLIFCPNCGMEMHISKKMLDKHGRSMPTCPCGAKMALDESEEEGEGAAD